MALYNMTWLNETNTFYDVSNQVNALTGNSMFGVFTMLVWIVAFLGMKRYDNSTSGISASILTMLVSILFWSAGLVGPQWMLLYLVAFFGFMMLGAFTT